MGFENPKSVYEEEREKLSRRQFLKVAGGTTAALGAAAVGMRFEQESRVEEKDLVTEGEIVDKRFSSPHASGTQLRGKALVPVVSSERFEIDVVTTRGKATLPVSKEEFDSYAAGDKVTVKFKRHTIPGETIIHEGLGIESIVKK